MEQGFSGGLRTASAYKPMVHSLGIKFNGEMRETSTSCLFGQKELLREGELGSKDPSSVIDTDGRNSFFMDSKPRRFVEFEDARNDKCPKDTSFLSVPSTVPAKKIRLAGLNGQIPCCQVLGCNKNLSSSKDYYKRHKVCEIHSKTAKVIVNGIEQRFCQQCSRFHLLTEFDNGKRSCRRRLAGHNERRRKPQLDIHSGRAVKFPPYYHGGRFMDTSLPIRPSFLCPEIDHSGILHELKNDSANWFQHVKVVDDKFPSNRQTPMSNTEGLLLSKPFLHCSTEKQYSSIQNVCSPSGNMSYEDWGQIQHGYASDGSNVQAFPSVGESICALSLLSTQSQNAYVYASTIPMVQSLMSPGGQAQNSITQFPNKPLSVISQASTSLASNSFSSGMNSGEDKQADPLGSDPSNVVCFEVQTGGVYQGSQFMNMGEPSSPEPGNTVNLLQLSTLLQSAEERRMSVLAKQEYEALSCHPITQVQ